MSDGDYASILGKFREDVRQALVIAQFSIMDEQHYGHRGELLRAGCKAEIRIRVDCCSRPQISQAMSGLNQRLSIFTYQHCDSGLGGGRYAGEHLLDLGFP